MFQKNKTQETTENVGEDCDELEDIAVEREGRMDIGVDQYEDVKDDENRLEECSYQEVGVVDGVGGPECVDYLEVTETPSFQKYPGRRHRFRDFAVEPGQGEIRGLADEHHLHGTSYESIRYKPSVQTTEVNIAGDFIQCKATIRKCHCFGMPDRL
ncbi:hypothetical protein AAG570_003418 [Ranatra chinensis]|uniref:Uncharacterized protein n=1 Tax=Ranatra chinensis TaxID=642074 RepID=A0ABD0Y3K4_9HEMI